MSSGRERSSLRRPPSRPRAVAGIACADESGVPLRSMTDAPESRASHKIRKLTVHGGFWDGLELSFAAGLNCIIGARGTGTDVLLALSGPVTAVPLMLFAFGARRLRLATMGFLQYIAPTLNFLMAVFVFREPLGCGQLLTFVLIWAGLAVYTADALRNGQRS